MIVVDTSVWVDFFRNEDSPERLLLHQLIEDEEDVAITEIILAEILQGIKDNREFLETKDYLLDFPVYSPQGVETYINAAEIYRECRRQGKTVRKMSDCIIAAICLEYNLMLLQKDHDFKQIAQCYALELK